MKDTASLRLDATDKVQLDQFRSGAAGIIRDLLAAAERDGQSVVSIDCWQQWWNDGRLPSKRPVEYLLRHAAVAFRRFAHNFAGCLDSVPALNDASDQSPVDRVERLRELLLLFADPDELDEFARRTKERRSKTWRRLCRWSSVSEIRHLLDHLPENQAKEPTQTSWSKIELVCESPGYIIQYLDDRIEGVRPLIWKLVNYLLNCDKHVSHIDAMVGPVWDDEVKTNVWYRVDSAIGATKEIFKAKNWPFDITSCKPLRTIFLKRIVPSLNSPRTSQPVQDKKRSKSMKTNAPNGTNRTALRKTRRA